MAKNKLKNKKTKHYFGSLIISHLQLSFIKMGWGTFFNNESRTDLDVYSYSGL